MSKFSSLSSENKARGRARDWLAARLRAAGERIFAADDQAAREHGWEIVTRHGGLSRRYRDPRFDTLARCGWCRGSGSVGDLACHTCRGTGTVTLPQPPGQGGHREGRQETRQGERRDDTRPEGGEGRAEEPFAQAQ